MWTFIVYFFDCTFTIHIIAFKTFRYVISQYYCLCKAKGKIPMSGSIGFPNKYKINWIDFL